MTPETSGSTTTTSATPLHCQHRSSSGRRFCRMAISHPDSGLCSRHAAEHQKDLDQVDLAAALIGSIEEFRSAADINHSLGELYKLPGQEQNHPAPPSWPTPPICFSAPSLPSSTKRQQPRTRPRFQ